MINEDEAEKARNFRSKYYVVGAIRK